MKWVSLSERRGRIGATVLGEMAKADQGSWRDVWVLSKVHAAERAKLCAYCWTEA